MRRKTNTSPRTYQALNPQAAAAVAAASNSQAIYATGAAAAANATLGTTNFATKTGGKIRARAFFSYSMGAVADVAYYLLINNVTVAIGTVNATKGAGFLEGISAGGLTQAAVVFGYTCSGAITIAATAAGVIIQEQVPA